MGICSRLWRVAVLVLLAGLGAIPVAADEGFYPGDAEHRPSKRYALVIGIG